MNFHLETDHPIAADSLDHLYPVGTRLDNSVNPYFNEAIMAKYGRPISVLDFGCAGGGMVQSLIRDGHTAIGLEGSDYSQNRKRAAWEHISNNLFTCDLGYPFTLTNGSPEPYKFDIVTMWEFVEHLPEDRLPQMMANAVKHLKPGGCVLGSTTDTQHMTVGGGKYPIHQTAKPISWWYEQFEKHGLRRYVEFEQYLTRRNAWVRNIKYTFALQLDK